MKLSAQRFIGVTALLLIYTLVALHNFSLLTLAQEPAPFEISLTPQAEQAVSGQPFTYTVAITNVSQSPLKDIVVRARTPEGSVFVESYFVNPNWLVGGVQPGQAGEIIWLTQEPFAPGEAMTFDLVVNVLPELAGQQLVNEEYTVATIDNSQLLASGPPVKTQVLIPTPTPSPTVELTDTPVPTATFSPTPLLQATPSVATSTPIPIVAFTPTSQVSNAVIDTSTTTSQSTTSGTSSINIFVIIGILGLLLLIVGLVWFWKYR